MDNTLLLIFSVNLALLFVHEMDAIWHSEWKMFIVLKDMEDKKAYFWFTLLHIPLYAAILFLLLSQFKTIGFYFTDIFLIIHLLIHLCFTKHKNNQLNGAFSKIIIFVMGILSVIHLVFMQIK